MQRPNAVFSERAYPKTNAVLASFWDMPQIGRIRYVILNMEKKFGNQRVLTVSTIVARPFQLSVRNWLVLKQRLSE